MKTLFKSAGITLALLAAAGAASAGTTTYTGTIRTYVVKSTMPLGSGDSVVTANSEGAASLSGSPPALLEIRCTGMGLVTTADTYSADFYCALSQDSENTLDIKGTDGATGNKFTVIGGTGKWKGAAGEGRFTRQTSSTTEAISTFELVLTTP